MIPFTVFKWTIWFIRAIRVGTAYSGVVEGANIEEIAIKLKLALKVFLLYAVSLVSKCIILEKHVNG